MKMLFFAFMSVLTSCASLGTAMVSSVVSPKVSYTEENRTVHETRTVNETRNIQQVNITIPKDVEPKKALEQVPSTGIKESKVYFYAAP